MFDKARGGDAEIDGVGVKKEVSSIGATNRPELLDEALLRLVPVA